MPCLHVTTFIIASSIVLLIYSCNKTDHLSYKHTNIIMFAIYEILNLIVNIHLIISFLFSLLPHRIYTKNNLRTHHACVLNIYMIKDIIIIRFVLKVTLCMIGITFFMLLLSSTDCLFKKSLRSTIRVSKGLDPDQDNVLVATHHSMYVTSFWNVVTLHK